MSIKDKIEEIKQKPEHIRIRYAWGLSVFCTVLIVIIWIVTLAAQNNAEDDSSSLSDQEEIFDELGEQKEAIGETGGQLKKSLENQTGKMPQDNLNQRNGSFDVENEGFSGVTGE